MSPVLDTRPTTVVILEDESIANGFAGGFPFGADEPPPLVSGASGAYLTLPQLEPSHLEVH